MAAATPDYRPETDVNAYIYEHEDRAGSRLQVMTGAGDLTAFQVSGTSGEVTRADLTPPAVAELASALALRVPADPHPALAFINAINGTVIRRCYPDTGSAWAAASGDLPWNNTRIAPGWCAGNGCAFALDADPASLAREAVLRADERRKCAALIRADAAKVDGTLMPVVRAATLDAADVIDPDVKVKTRWAFEQRDPASPALPGGEG